MLIACPFRTLIEHSLGANHCSEYPTSLPSAGTSATGKDHAFTKHSFPSPPSQITNLIQAQALGFQSVYTIDPNTKCSLIGI